MPPLTADVYSLTNRKILHAEKTALTLAVDGSSVAFPLNLKPLMDGHTIFVKLELKLRDGQLISQNFYWLADKEEDYRDLDTLPQAQIVADALENKLTLLNAGTGKRILPAYYTDNYVSMLPGETREITIDYPKSAAEGAKPELNLRGFNLNSRTISAK